MHKSSRFFGHNFAHVCEIWGGMLSEFMIIANRVLGFLTAREFRELLRQIPASNEDFV